MSVPAKLKCMADFTLNNLFSQFIQEWIDETRAAHTHGSSFSSHVGFIYKKAHESLKKYPLPLVTPGDALKVNGIGKTLMARLEKKLASHVVTDADIESDLANPIISIVKKRMIAKAAEPLAIIDRDMVERAKADLVNKSPPPIKKKRVIKQREYIPAYRSGAFAILVALAKSTRDVFMDKSEIIRGGQPLCDISFDIPDAKSSLKYGYTAWSSMKTLIERELVYKYGNPARFCLTEDGDVIAQKLLKVTDANQLDPTSDYASDGSAASSSHERFPVAQTTLKRTLLHAEANTERERQYKRTNVSPRRIPIIPIMSPSPYKPLVPTIYSPRNTTSSLSRNQTNDAVICISSDNDTSIIDMTKSSPTYTSRFQPTVAPLSSRPLDFDRSSSRSSQSIASTDHQLPQHLIDDLLSAPQICLQKQNYDICLVLDSREVRQQKDRSYFQDNLQRAGITCLTRSLSLGDALWIARPRDPACYDEIILDVIVERKTMSDLVGSVRDGRFKEQGFRLCSSCIRDVVYLVEEDSGGQGNVAGEFNGFGIGAIRASYCHSMVANGFFVKLTKDCEDTLSYLTAMTRFLQNKYEGINLYAIPSRCVTKPLLPDIKTYLEKRYKDRNYFLTFSLFQELNLKTKSNTMNDIWTKQLLCVRGISAEKAVSISRQYPTMRRYVTYALTESSVRLAYLKCKTDKEREALLKTTVVGTGRQCIQNGMSKKISSLFNASEYE